MKITDIVNLTPHTLDIETVESGTIQIPPKTVYCHFCGGRGWIIPPDNSMDRTCTVCKGEGQVPQVARVVPIVKPKSLPALVVGLPCRSCEGTGIEFNDQDTMAHGGACCVCGGNPRTVSIPRIIEAQGQIQGLPNPCGGCGGRGGYEFPGVLPDGTAGQLFHDCNECGGRSYIVSRVVREALDRQSEAGAGDRPDVWSPVELIRATPGLPAAIKIIEDGLRWANQGYDFNVDACNAALEEIKTILLARQGQPVACKGLRQ